MKTIQYSGRDDFQVFSRRDFAKAKIDHDDVRFARGVPVEVSNELADALLSGEGLFGPFSFEEVKEPSTPAPSSEEEDMSDSDQPPAGGKKPKGSK